MWLHCGVGPHGPHEPHFSPDFQTALKWVVWKIEVYSFFLINLSIHEEHFLVLQLSSKLNHQGARGEINIFTDWLVWPPQKKIYFIHLSSWNILLYLGFNLRPWPICIEACGRRYGQNKIKNCGKSWIFFSAPWRPTLLNKSEPDLAVQHFLALDQLHWSTRSGYTAKNTDYLKNTRVF